MMSPNLRSATRFLLTPSRTSTALTLLFLALATAVASAQVTGWPDFQFGNDRLGFNPYERALSASNVNQLGIVWQAHPVSDVIYASPVLANGLLYDITFDTGQLFALNAGTGAVVWQQTLQGQFFVAAPAVVGNVLYVGVGFYTPYYTGAVYAVNALNGQILWSNGNVHAVQTAPTVGNGLVYVADDFGVISALDASTGQIQWSYNTNTSQGTGSAGALVNGVLYMGVSQFLFALNASDGTLVWRQEMSAFTASSPAVQNGVVYMNSADGGVYAFDAATGAAIWHHAIRVGYGNSLSIANGSVYLCGYEGAPGLVALNAQTGATVWSRAIVQCNFASPTVANGVVYVGWESEESINSHIMAFDAGTGTQLWQQLVGSPIYGEPIVVNGKLYITTYSGEVTAFGLNQD
jgi:eukaryotic-like serine/threonine-protein kinase